MRLLALLLPLVLAPLAPGGVAPAAWQQPRWLRARDSLAVLLLTGAIWALGLAGLAAALDRPGAGSWLGWILAIWLLAAPGAIGLYFGRWLWLLPVATGLGALAWIAPAGLDSRLGNLTWPAIILAVAPAATLTGFGVALRPRPLASDDGEDPEADSGEIEKSPGE